MIYITRKEHFSASHILTNKDFSKERIKISLVNVMNIMDTITILKLLCVEI